MIFYKNNVEFQIEESTVITLGKFDGLHSGHQYLIQKVQEKKRIHGYKGVVFTFIKPPLEEVIGNSRAQISTMEEKEHLFSSIGIDYVIEYPFNQEVMMMSAEDFIHMIVTQCNVKCFVIGSDFHFGYQRKGNYKLLQDLASNYGYEVVVVEKKQFQQQDISSSWIRSTIEEGNIELANELLGYDFFIQGNILKGNQIGRTIGIPTINLIPEKEKLLPPFGVYASKIEIEGHMYYGITNIGRKPTVGKDNPIGVETHIFDFNQELYGKNVCIHLLSYVRSEKHFQGIHELKEQIQKDISIIKNTWGIE